MSRRYLTVAEVLEIHSVQVASFGGSREIRDSGLLQASVFRPQSGYYGDTIAEAAGMWESLAQNHPFMDGNKRTALATTLTFLKINGMECTAAPAEVIDFILQLYESHDFTFERLDAWLRSNTRASITPQQSPSR